GERGRIAWRASSPSWACRSARLTTGGCSRSCATWAPDRQRSGDDRLLQADQVRRRLEAELGQGGPGPADDGQRRAAAALLQQRGRRPQVPGVVVGRQVDRLLDDPPGLVQVAAGRGGGGPPVQPL